MSSEIIFKKCFENDINSLIAISNQFYPEHYTHIWKNNDPSYYINLSFTENVFIEDFRVPNIKYYIIQQNGEDLGLIKIKENEKITKFSAQEALQLEKIYLLKKSVGIGIGKKGIEFVKKYALKLAKKVIWLDVMTTSPALHFYQKNGFRTISKYDLDYPNLKSGYREMQRMILLV